MANSIRLLVLLTNDTLERIDLPVVPDTVEDLIEHVKEACRLTGNIRLQYKDDDFGGIFVNLSSISMIKDLNTIKVIPSVPDNIILEFIDSVPTEFSDVDSSCITTHTENDSDDTSILSSSSSERLRTEPWPKEFIIPSFSFETEGQLEKRNAEYLKNRTRLTP